MVKRRKAERSWQVLIYDHTGRVPPTAPMLSLQRMFAKLQISAPGPGFHRRMVNCSDSELICLLTVSLQSPLLVFSFFFGLWITLQIVCLRIVFFCIRLWSCHQQAASQRGLRNKQHGTGETLEAGTGPVPVKTSCRRTCSSVYMVETTIGRFDTISRYLNWFCNMSVLESKQWYYDVLCALLSQDCCEPVLCKEKWWQWLIM